MCIESVNNEMADDRVEENMFEEDWRRRRSVTTFSIENSNVFITWTPT